jgi:hypothetical protein
MYYLLQDKLNKLIEQLHPNITDIICEYSGSGDEGSIESVEFLSGKLDANLNISNELRDGFNNFFYDYLEEKHPGWEINDGSSGKIDIDVKNRMVTIVHNEYYSDSNTYTDEDKF